MLASIPRAWIVVEKSHLRVSHRTHTHTLIFFVMVSNAIAQQQHHHHHRKKRRNDEKNSKCNTTHGAIKEAHISIWKNCKFLSLIPIYCIASHGNKLSTASAYMQIHIHRHHIPYCMVLFCSYVYALCYQYVTHLCMNEWMIEIEMFPFLLPCTAYTSKVGYAWRAREKERLKATRAIQMYNDEGEKKIEPYPILICLWISMGFLSWEPFYAINWNWIFELCLAGKNCREKNYSSVHFMFPSAIKRDYNVWTNVLASPKGAEKSSTVCLKLSDWFGFWLTGYAFCSLTSCILSAITD